MITIATSSEIGANMMMYNSRYLKISKSLLATAILLFVISPLVYLQKIFSHDEYKFNKRDLLPLAITLLCIGKTIWLMIHSVNNNVPQRRLISVLFLSLTLIVETIYRLSYKDKDTLGMTMVSNLLNIIAATLLVSLQLIEYYGNPHSPFESFEVNTTIKV
jgi:uncharacterized membrane protein